MDKWLPSIVSLLIALIGFGGSLLLVRGQRRKLEAESTQLIVNAAGNLVDDLNVEIKRLREEIAALKEEVKGYKDQLDKLQVALSHSEQERKQLQKQVVKLETEFKSGMATMSERVQALTTGIGVLTKQIQELGKIPAWTDK